MIHLRPQAVRLSLLCFFLSGWLTATQAQDTGITCAGFLPSRLVIGQSGAITPGAANNLRSEAGGASKKLGQIPGDGVIRILAGPICGDNGAWWQVDYNGLIGWTLEGQGDDYWINPVSETASQATVMPVGTAFPLFTTAAGNIVYSYNGEIYTMSTDGTQPQRITHHPLDDAGDISPVWSPDGAQIAFVSDRDGNYEIYVMRADGTDVRRLTYSEYLDGGPNWSPDGTQIVFYSTIDQNWEIFVIRPDGSDLRRLTTNTGEDREPAWSPDGTRIVFTAARVGVGTGLFIMAADGSNQQKLMAASESDGSPIWSPDGTQIVFDSYREGAQNIYVVAADGSNLRRLTNHRGKDANPTWSPDGTQILFTSDRQVKDRYQLYIMEADGSNVRPLGIAGQSPDWRVFSSNP